MGWHRRRYCGWGGFRLFSDYIASFFPVAEAIEEVLGIPTSYNIGLLAYSLPASLAIGLGAGVTRTLGYLLRVGLNVTRADEHTVIMAPTLKQTTSNARLFTIWLAVAGAIAGILLTTLVLIITDLAGGFLSQGIIWTILGLPFPLVVGFGGSVICAMSALREFGGLVAIQRLIAQYALRRQHTIPANYAEFLDQLVKLRLMHKVGIGYRFFHDLFQRHLANAKAQHVSTPSPRDG